MLGLYDGDEPRHDHLEVVLNKRGHGQTVKQLARALARLSSRGWIDFYRLKSAPQSELSDVEAAISKRGTFAAGWYYAHTADGGRVWGAFARPDWQSYIEDDDEKRPDGIYVRTVRVANERRLRRYLAVIAEETEIEVESRELRVIAPWQVTYWKTLPVALKCTFRCWRRAAAPRGPSTSRLRSRWCDWL